MTSIDADYGRVTITVTSLDDMRQIMTGAHRLGDDLTHDLLAARRIAWPPDRGQRTLAIDEAS